MAQQLLEWKGKTYRVESCATCPARTMDEGGVSKCEIRGARLHARIKGLFPSVKGYKILGYLPCPIYREGTKRLTPKSERIDKIKVSMDKPESKIYCNWCSCQIVDMAEAAILVNYPKPGKVRFHHQHCHLEYSRTLEEESEAKK
jgi:hypothetical protein